MSPVRTPSYPPYDVHRILDALRSPRDDHFVIAAHRGSRFKGATENSYSAIAAAARAGCECIEVDIQLSRDGVPVVLHDDGLGRILALEEGERYNPFTGKGFSPLVCETNWEGPGGIKEGFLRDENGDETGEHPISLAEMLEFIETEGINIVVMLDVKDVHSLGPSQEVLSRFRNASGVPALTWCVFKLEAAWHPTPEILEAQDWVQRAMQSGGGFSYIPVYRPQAMNEMDVIGLIKAWEHKDYVVAFEVGLRGTGGLLQEAADYLRERPGFKGMGGFQPMGDLPLPYYIGRATSWDDSGVRAEILAGGLALPRLFHEFRPITTAHQILLPGESPSGVDDRDNLDWTLANGFSWTIADFVDDLAAELERRGKRNTRALCRDTKVDEA